MEKIEIEKLEEINTYLLINEIGGFIWQMNHDMADGRIERSHHAAIDRDIEEVKKIQIEAVKSLTRFQITPLEEEKPTAEYWAWFRWWDVYIKGMSDEQLKELESKLNSKQDISSYRPTGNWRDNIEKEKTI